MQVTHHAICDHNSAMYAACVKEGWIDRAACSKVASMRTASVLGNRSSQWACADQAPTESSTNMFAPCRRAMPHISKHMGNPNLRVVLCDAGVRRSCAYQTSSTRIMVGPPGVVQQCTLWRRPVGNCHLCALTPPPPSMHNATYQRSSRRDKCTAHSCARAMNPV